MWENLKCLYAENLKNQRITFAVVAVRNAPDPLFCQSGQTAAWDVMLDKKAKDGCSIYIQIPKQNANGKAAGILRQYVMVMGSEPCDEHKGKQLTLYPAASKKSLTGQAIRIAVPEAHA